MLRLFLITILAMSFFDAMPGRAATIRVPTDYKSIQAAIDAAMPGDCVLVSGGTYHESIRLKERILLRSEGDDTAGKLGLKRAESTILDGGGKVAKRPAVVMAEGAVIDGFTITRVGQFEQKQYDWHFATHGELLPDDRGAVGIKEFPALAVSAVSATIRFCIIQNNGHAGIGILGEGNRSNVIRNIVHHNMGGGIGIANGATPIVEANKCFNNLRGGIGNRKSAALIVNNECYENVRAGIGIREGAKPTVRDNKCYKNRRAGIGVRMEGSNPLLENNVCHENEMAGIGCRDDAAPIIRNNRCFKNRMAGIGARDRAFPLIEKNDCYENEMAGIGVRLEAYPVIRNNRCYRNQMAGIGSREKARPIIEGNECYENKMAGIGSRDKAVPIIRNNRCYKNEMAGIGSRLGARPLIVENECFNNQMAGIGSEDGAVPIVCRNRCYKNEMAGIVNREGVHAILVENESRENKKAGIGVESGSRAIILGNKCHENRLVAIGLPDGASAYIHGNDLLRTEASAPPLVAVRGGASAVLTHNRLRGGGVAGVLIQGTGYLHGNVFEGRGPDKQGSAVWVWDKSTVVIGGNRIKGYRNAINAVGASVTAFANQTLDFQGSALIVRKPSVTARVFDNLAITDKPDNNATAIDGATNRTLDNKLQPASAEKNLPAIHRLWPFPENEPRNNTVEQYRKDTGPNTVVLGPWKLVVSPGEKSKYQLFNTQIDPTGKIDFATQLPHITFRLRGLRERQKSNTIKSKERPTSKVR